MSLIRPRSHPRAILLAAFAMLLAAALTFVAAGLGAAGAASDEPSKPGPSIAEGTGRTIEQSSLTVPARAPAPGGRCPQAWSYFDNTVMHYGLCVPPGWGFSDFSSPDPMDAVPVPQLENLHLLGDAFPWVPGRLPFDVIQASGALDVELDLLPAGARDGRMRAHRHAARRTPDVPHLRADIRRERPAGRGWPAARAEGDRPAGHDAHR
ncbi:MAG: hypothetical protein ACXVD9_12985 [Actinomycetota bacterium]